MSLDVGTVLTCLSVNWSGLSSASGHTRALEQASAKVVRLRQCLLYSLARQMDGLAHVMGRPISKACNFFNGKTFQREKDERFTIFGAHFMQHLVQLRHHLFAGKNLFRRA